MNATIFLLLVIQDQSYSITLKFIFQVFKKKIHPKTLGCIFKYYSVIKSSLGSVIVHTSGL